METDIEKIEITDLKFDPKPTTKKPAKKKTAKKKKKTARKKPGNKPGSNGGGGVKPIPDPFTNQEELDKLESLSASGMTVDQIAGLYRMGKTTFYNLMKQNDKIRTYLDFGRSVGIYNVAKTLQQKAKDGDMTAAIFFLKTRAGWREVQDIHHTGEVKHNLEIEAVRRIDEMSPTQRADRLRQLEKMEQQESDLETIDVEVV